MNETYSSLEKISIANQIKNISIQNVEKEMLQLIEIGSNADKLSPRCKIGNNIVDYFTFKERLETKGKYNVNFYEFISNIEQFKEKKFIQTMINYYKNIKNKNNTKNEYTVLKEIYNICISAINIMRPLCCMEIYTKYNGKNVLNFCAGWGGSTVAATALHLPNYIGIEINHQLKAPYEKMVNYLKGKSTTNFTIIFDDALNVDYSQLDYDLVFTSPPYYFLEKYKNNSTYISKTEMNEKFYKPIFLKTYKGLKKGGYYIINVCPEVYNIVLKEILGEAHEMFPFKKSKRQNNYQEMVYVWKKKLINTT
jgi:16S rRNA G966 N2-methylase RsmD